MTVAVPEDLVTTRKKWKIVFRFQTAENLARRDLKPIPPENYVLGARRFRKGSAARRKRNEIRRILDGRKKKKKNWKTEEFTRLRRNRMSSDGREMRPALASRVFQRPVAAAIRPTRFVCGSTL